MHRESSAKELIVKDFASDKNFLYMNILRSAWARIKNGWNSPKKNTWGSDFSVKFSVEIALLVLGVLGLAILGAFRYVTSSSRNQESQAHYSPSEGNEEHMPRAIEIPDTELLTPGYVSIEITSIEGVNAKRWKEKLERKVASELGNGAKQATRKNNFPRIEIIAVFNEEVRDALRPPNYVPTLAVSSFHYGADGTLKKSQDKQYEGKPAKIPAQEADWDDLIKSAAIDIK